MKQGLAGAWTGMETAVNRPDENDQLAHSRRRIAAGCIKRVFDLTKLEPAIRGTPVVESRTLARTLSQHDLKNFMKPTPQTSSKQSHIGQDAHARFPLTDFSYQPAAKATKSSTTIAAPKKCEPSQLRPFWKLSSEYFHTKPTWDYAGETIFFAWISCLAAWPVCVMIHQLLTMAISPDLTGGWR